MMTDGAHLCAKALSAWVENCLSQLQILNNGCCFTVTNPSHRCAMCITVQNKCTWGEKLTQLSFGLKILAPT